MYIYFETFLILLKTISRKMGSANKTDTTKNSNQFVLTTITFDEKDLDVE